jgi:hypothetical protein
VPGAVAPDKASDYRISPFELENVLIEHEPVAEAAVVPAPDPLRLAVPKAYVALAFGWEPTRETAMEILRFARERLALTSASAGSSSPSCRRRSAARSAASSCGRSPRPAARTSSATTTCASHARPSRDSPRRPAARRTRLHAEDDPRRSTVAALTGR